MSLKIEKGSPAWPPGQQQALLNVKKKLQAPFAQPRDFLENILLTAKKRPVIIQSLLSSVDHVAPSNAEIAAYAQTLKKLKVQGANIAAVQIYSATRPTATSRVDHLPLRTMAEIAATVRSMTGLRTEVF